MAIEPTLEELRPREWSVCWAYRQNGRDQWYSDDRLWETAEGAVGHARALAAMEAATGDIRSVSVSSRMVKLEPGEWIDYVWADGA